VFWYASGDNNKLYSVDSDAVVHQDFIDALNEFRVVFATSQETLEGWTHARDFIKGNDNALKNAVIGYDEEIERWLINSFEFKGSGENEGVVLKGNRQLALGKVRTESPLVKFNSECGVDDLQSLTDKLKEEVWQYVFKAKRANDLFADLPDDQRGFDIEVNEEENVQKENPKISSKKPQKAGLNVA
jgi:hypothetical protein